MNQVLELVDKQRICRACKKQKPIAEFFFHKGNKGYTHKCLPCHTKLERKRQNEFWANNPEYREPHNAKGKINRIKNPDKRSSDMKSRPDRVKRLYGVTYEHVVQTLANQFGRCANIGCCKEISLETQGMRSNRAVIDHNHTTGKFRALLCITCNTTLGILETQTEKVLGLMDYMRKHNN